jgi:cation diffusion facilitator family transporter
VVRPQVAAVQRVLLVILALNLAVAAGKGIAAWATGSLALASDVIHSTLDAVSNVIGLLALRVAARPPDAGHPYGHAKVEALAAAVVGLLIGAGALRFGWTAIRSLFDGHRMEPLSSGFAAVLATLVVNLFVAAWEGKRGRELRSRFLVADAAHTASDVLATVAVLLAFLGSRAGLRWADPAASLVVLVIILRVAWRILTSNLGVLLDKATIDAHEIERIARQVPGVGGAHRIRSRGLGDSLSIDLHLTARSDLALSSAHALAHEVEARLRALTGVADITIHVEPPGDPEESL